MIMILLMIWEQSSAHPQDYAQDQEQEQEIEKNTRGNTFRGCFEFFSKLLTSR